SDPSPAALAHGARTPVSGSVGFLHAPGPRRRPCESETDARSRQAGASQRDPARAVRPPPSSSRHREAGEVRGRRQTGQNAALPASFVRARARPSAWGSDGDDRIALRRRAAPARTPAALKPPRVRARECDEAPATAINRGAAPLPPACSFVID
ncbi:hypothetical protein PVAP13_7KG242655, partial [Panicum virgatum]